MPAQTPESEAEPGRQGGLSGLRAFSQDTLDRLYAFRVIYVAIFVFILLYVFTIRGAEQLLQNHFTGIVRDAIRITDLGVPVKTQIQARLDGLVDGSRWVRWGGVQATVIVLARDGATWIYVAGRTTQPMPSLDPAEIAREAEKLLPAQEEVILSVPHNALLANAILVSYAAVLLSGLFFYNRAVGRRERGQLQEAVAARDLTVLRAESIEQELEDSLPCREIVEQATMHGVDRVVGSRDDRSLLG